MNLCILYTKLQKAAKKPTYHQLLTVYPIGYGLSVVRIDFPTLCQRRNAPLIDQKTHIPFYFGYVLNVR
jgi:hypothetical protein